MYFAFFSIIGGPNHFNSSTEHKEVKLLHLKTEKGFFFIVPCSVRKGFNKCDNMKNADKINYYMNKI